MFGPFIKRKEDLKMKLTTVFFDLDGTLLPMDQNAFLRAYFSAIAKYLSAYGYEPRRLVEAIGAGAQAILKSDRTRTNEEVFWDTFSAVYGKDARCDEAYFAEFYERDYDALRAYCSPDPRALQTVDAVRRMGLRVVLATTPVFPEIATRKRMAWAGFSPEDFACYTTYENSHGAKPSLGYYQELLDRFGLCPEETLMVGNDVDDDMVARDLGMDVFLMTNCLINTNNADISSYPNGDFDALMSHIRARLSED